MKTWLHGPITEMARVNQEIPSMATCKQDQTRAPVTAGTATSATQLEKKGILTLTPTSGGGGKGGTQREPTLSAAPGPS